MTQDQTGTTTNMSRAGRAQAPVNPGRIRALSGIYDTAHLLVDFAAALCFVIGSYFYFFPDLFEGGTWMFLIGSIFFAVKPTLRLVHKIHQAALHARAAVERVNVEQVEQEA